MKSCRTEPCGFLGYNKRMRIGQSLTIGIRLLLALNVVLAFLVVMASGLARADVIVLANRAGMPLSARFHPDAGAVQQVSVPAGAVMPLFVDGPANLQFATPGMPKKYQLAANCAYYFGRAGNGVTDLQKIGLGEDESTMKGRKLPGSVNAPPAVVTVKILVDEEEPGRQALWEQRLRRRVAAASAILEQTCRVQLKVVAVGTWNSDNRTTDFTASLNEFEREVKPYPARVAIGFTSQFPIIRGRTHMAGTRGPLHSHIFAREGSPQISEAEKLEFLVHELGHYMGASHSPERDSVMRPVLGDNRAGSANFRIQFDPVNTLIMSLVGEELRRRDIKKFDDLTTDTKRRLRQIYSQLLQAIPDDPAGARYLAMTAERASSSPLATGTRQVLQAIVRAAISNAALPPPPATSPNQETRRSGDELTELYVRAAALAASSLKEEVGPKAFLLALGIGLGDSNVLRALPNMANLIDAAEPPSEKMRRIVVLGQPTMLGRGDLGQHFVLSAFLTATAGMQSAEAAGLAKEVVDAQGPSGFSFTDIAADRAGIRFADGVLKKRLPLATLSKNFVVKDYVPSVEGLPEGLPAKTFTTDFGSKADPRFQKQIREIDERIMRLPAYRPLVTVP